MVGSAIWRALESEKLGWVPKYDLKGLVEEMVQAELELFERDIKLRSHGFSTLNQAE